MTLDTVHRRLAHDLFDAFVQQHTIHVTRADGFEGHMEVCFVAYTRDGMISRAYEYFDTGQIEKFIGPLPTKEEAEQ